MSGIYCVILKQGDDDASKTVEEAYPTSHRLSPTVYLIDSEQTAREVAVRLGIRPIKDGEQPTLGEGGVVFSINGQYSGFGPKEVWDWLNTHPLAS